MTRIVPWLSLFLLLVSYSTFSWFLSRSAANWLIWILVILFAISQSLLLTTLADGLKSILDTWLQSDLGYFTTVIIAAMLLAFTLVWIKIFGYILVLIASEMLARLELQTLGFNRFQSFLMLTSLSFLGIFLGQIISRFI